MDDDLFSRKAISHVQNRTFPRAFVGCAEASKMVEVEARSDGKTECVRKCIRSSKTGLGKGASHVAANGLHSGDDATSQQALYVLLWQRQVEAFAVTVLKPTPPKRRRRVKIRGWKGLESFDQMKICTPTRLAEAICMLRGSLSSRLQSRQPESISRI